MQVKANDLNPASHKFLEENIRLNKVDAAVQAFCMDGCAFIHQMCRSWDASGKQTCAMQPAHAPCTQMRQKLVEVPVSRQ